MFPSVTKKQGAGCAVACVAWILNVSYDAALKLFSRPKQAIDHGFLCREIVSALNKGGKRLHTVKQLIPIRSLQQFQALLYLLLDQKSIL